MTRRPAAARPRRPAPPARARTPPREKMYSVSDEHHGSPPVSGVVTAGGTGGADAPPLRWPNRRYSDGSTNRLSRGEGHRPPLLLFQMLAVVDQQDPVAGGDPEHGEEADQRA